MSLRFELLRYLVFQPTSLAAPVAAGAAEAETRAEAVVAEARAGAVEEAETRAEPVEAAEAALRASSAAVAALTAVSRAE